MRGFMTDLLATFFKKERKDNTVKLDKAFWIRQTNYQIKNILFPIKSGGTFD